MKLPFNKTIQAFLFMVVSIASIQGEPTQDTAPAPHASLSAKQIKAIDVFVATEMARQHLPGLAIGIYSRGRVLLTKGYGLANVELDAPVKLETIFQSGSVGKQFTAAAIMLLVEDGKLSLDDSITKYFPDAPASWKPILIKNLLSHTSGLEEYTGDHHTGSKDEFDMRLDFTEDQLISKIEGLPVEWAPGDKWAYRNTNYVILGVLIHKITGKPYGEFLDERIFKPLGMTSTRIISEHDIIPNRAAGYILEDGQLKNQDWVSPTFNSTADGSLYYNVVDLAKWDEALWTTRLLKQSSLDLMWTVFLLNNGKPNPGEYGFGWEIGKLNGHKIIQHDGAWQGFSGDIARYPDSADGITVVALANLHAGTSDTSSITHVIAGLIDPPLFPAKLEAIADAEPAIATSARALLDQMTAGADIRPLIGNPALAARITPASIKKRQQRISKLWPGGELTLVERTPLPDVPGQVRSTFRLVKNGEGILVVYTLGPDGKIAELGFMQDRPYR